MYPHERSLVKRLEGKPFALVGVNSDQDKVALKEAMKKENITWRSFWDGGSTQGPIAKRFAIEGWPTLYLIDHQGVIRKKWLGSPGDKVLDREIDKLVKEAEAKK
jgi:hypothetical protein